jgi:hypothetical protein
MCQVIREIETEMTVAKAMFVGALKGVVYPRDEK